MLCAVSVCAVCAGYVLDGLPSAGRDWKSVSDQVQLLQDLDLPPDIIVNLKVIEQELSFRFHNDFVQHI